VAGGFLEEGLLFCFGEGIRGDESLLGYSGCAGGGVKLGSSYAGVYWNTQMQAQQIIQPVLP